MEKTEKGNQGNKPKGLKNDRYCKNTLPEKKEKDPNHLPDRYNGERLKALH